MKFNFLLKRALEFGADYLATGHYARVEYDDKCSSYSLSKGIDKNKDQSYFLFTLGQKELKRLSFPLGDMTKPQVRELAKKLGVKVAEKSESMGVCFITGNSYREFLDPYLKNGKITGDIIDIEGNFVAKHNGIANFTVGQRRGLGFANGKPMYVVKVDAENNSVIVGEEKDLFNKTLLADNLSWVNFPPDPNEIVMAKIRYRSTENEALITIAEDKTAKVTFKNPQKAITPGQAVVFYKNDKVLGGGWIKGVAQ